MIVWLLLIICCLLQLSCTFKKWGNSSNIKLTVFSKAYDFVLFRTFIMLCNHHYYVAPTQVYLYHVSKKSWRVAWNKVY